MALAKLKVLVESGENEFNDEIEVIFNPNQVSISKQAKWQLTPAAERDTPASQFTYGEPASLSMELLFDSYEAKTDIRDHTGRVYHLTTVEQHGDLHRPPLIKLQWGSFDFDGFTWVLQSLNQRFTLFLSDGTPVRATLSCTFRQWRSDDTEARLLNRQSVDVAKTVMVKRGDTLSHIAFREYKDSTLWRPIANANDIDDPRQLTIGQTLVIPALTNRRSLRRKRT